MVCITQPGPEKWSRALRSHPRQQPSVLPCPVLSRHAGSVLQLLCGSIEPGHRGTVAPTPGPGVTRSMRGWAAGRLDASHTGDPAIPVLRGVGAHSPGPPALAPEPPPLPPRGSTWDRELQPARVSTRAWFHRVPEHSPHRKGRGSFHRVRQASTLGAPQTSGPEAESRAGRVGAERPLLAGLLHAGRAHAPTRSRVLEPEEAKGEAARAEGGHSCVLVPR